MASTDDQLAAKIGQVRDRVSHLVALRSPSPVLLEANEGVYGAVVALLAAHAQTGFTRYTEPCPAHVLSLVPGCLDCRVIERAGCLRCRDENGRPALPEDCEVRAVFTARVIQPVSEEVAGASGTGATRG